MPLPQKIGVEKEKEEEKKSANQDARLFQERKGGRGKGLAQRTRIYKLLREAVCGVMNSKGRKKEESARERKHLPNFSSAGEKKKEGGARSL